MICIKCKGIVALQAFTNSVCKICGVPITTPHMPAYRVCEECSKKYNLCQQCGENINGFDIQCLRCGSSKINIQKDNNGFYIECENCGIKEYR